MERRFNNLRGFDSSDDVLPKRITVPNIKTGLKEYYELRSWTSDGKIRIKK
jgi:aldehyde:ferredoxin oxidoreductase